MNHVYIDEYYYLSVEIRKRNIVRQIEAIKNSVYPHVPAEAQRSILDPLRFELMALTGEPDKPPKLDRAGLRNLKMKMAESRSIAIK